MVGAGLAIVPEDHSPTFYASTGNASVFHGWHTPSGLFDAVESIIGPFDLDPCAPDESTGSVRARVKFCAAEDGLTREWHGKVFMTNLRMQGLHIDGRFRLKLHRRTERPSRMLKKVITPLFDLVRVNLEVLRQFNQRFLAFDRGYRHFRRKCRAVMPARSSRHVVFSSLAASYRCCAENLLIPTIQIPAASSLFVLKSLRIMKSSRH